MDIKALKLAFGCLWQTNAESTAKWTPPKYPNNCNQHNKWSTGIVSVFKERWTKHKGKPGNNSTNGLHGHILHAFLPTIWHSAVMIGIAAAIKSQEIIVDLYTVNQNSAEYVSQQPKLESKPNIPIVLPQYQAQAWECFYLHEFQTDFSN